jgi:hypothetical protein
MPAPGPARSVPPAVPTAARIAALQAAATFAAGVVLGSSKALSSRDVLRVAAAFEAWLDRTDVFMNWSSAAAGLRCAATMAAPAGTRDASAW